jgi:hypothetical protein
MRQARALLLVLAAMALAPIQAWAMHQRVYSLEEIAREAGAIAEGRVAHIDRDGLRAVLLVERPIKGTPPARWMGVDLSQGGWGHPGIVARRLALGLPVILFFSRASDQSLALVYTNGTWFRVTAHTGPDPSRLGWELTHIELYLPRAFHGPTEQMAERIRDGLAGRRPFPQPVQESSQQMLSDGGGQGGVAMVGPPAPDTGRPPRPLPPVPGELLGPPPGAGIRVLEAESLPVLESSFSHAKAFWQIPQFDGRDFNFRSAAALLVCEAVEGQRLTLRFEAPAAGTYDLHLELARLVNVRSLGVLLDGSPLRGQQPAVLPRDTTFRSQHNTMGPIGADDQWPDGSPEAGDRPSTPMQTDLGGPPLVATFPGVRLSAGAHRLTLSPAPVEPGAFRLSLDTLSLCPQGCFALRPADRSTLARLRLGGDAEPKVLALSRLYLKSPSQVCALLKACSGSWRDAGWCLKLERTFGRGGPRALVHPPEHFLRLKRAEPQLTWRDLEGVLQRGGEVYVPNRDGSDLLRQLSRDFTLAELDPRILDTKFSGLDLVEWARKERSHRRPAPLVKGELLGRTLWSLAGRSLPYGWRPWEGLDQPPSLPRPGASISVGHLSPAYVAATPPRGSDPRGLLWFAGPSRAGYGAASRAAPEERLVPTIPGVGSYVLDLSLFAPDHTDEASPVLGGVFYTRRTSKSLMVGIAGRRPSTWGRPRQALLTVEPWLGVRTHVQLRADVIREGGRWLAVLTAYRAGGREVGRTQVDLGDAGRPPRLVPVVGLESGLAGCLPEVYLTGLSLRQVANPVPVPFVGGPSRQAPSPRYVAGMPVPGEEEGEANAPRPIAGGRLLILSAALLTLYVLRKRRA